MIHSQPAHKLARRPGSLAAAVGRHGALALLYAIFVLSGFSALVYQTAWQRMLGLFAGSDAVAATLVVGAFLFGLGLGSLLGAVVADRLSARAAGCAFALCELAIGCCAVASPFVLTELLFAYVAPLHPSGAMAALTVVVALLPPTLLMGMSLPLLARAAVDRIETASSRIGWLYGMNTLGAAAGAALGGFLLIGSLGYEGAVRVGAAINLVVGLLALLAAAWLPPGTASVRRTAMADSGSRTLVWGWCAAVFVSGFLIISLEIVWFRLLGTMMQSTVYAFALVLAVFLLGDAAGIVWGTRILARLRQPRLVFMALQAAMALLALGAVLLLHAGNAGLELARWFVLDTAYRVFGPLGGEARLLAWLMLALVTVLPPAFLLGMSFPIVQKAVQTDLGQVGRRVGLIQLANILGNTAGALVTGLVLLHVLGTAGTLRLIGLAGLAFALLLLRERRGAPTLALAVALAAVVVLLPGNAALWARLHGADPAAALVAEDRTGAALVRSRPDGKVPGADVLFVGGRWQSQMSPFMPVQGAMGVLAAGVHPHPKSVLMIGYGGGGTLWAIAGNPGLERIEVVEIVAPVIDVMRRYGADRGGAGRRLFDDRRIATSIGDGRHRLLHGQERYDVIVAEAIAPKAAHSGLLFSLEFFRQVRERLAPGGLCIEWAATDRVVATFRSVFPYVVRAGEALIGSDAPIPYAPDRLAERLRGPMRAHLEAGGWEPEALIAWLSARPIERWTPSDPPSGEINTDLFPKDEYYLNNG